MNTFNHIPTNDETIEKIRAVLPSFIDGKRLCHTFSVEEEALTLCDIFFPCLNICEKYKSDIRAACLLHDITKYLSIKEHKEILEKYNECEDVINSSEGVLHAFSGAYKARELFCVNDIVFSAIYFHTTGKENMNIFEKIIFIADYIEKGRTHTECIQTREFFYKNIYKAENKMEILDKAILMSFQNTLSFIQSKGLKVNPLTHIARLFLLAEYALQ